MSAERSRGGKPNMIIFDEAGQFPNVQQFKNLIGEGEAGPFKWIAGLDSYQDLTEKHERRKLTTVQ